MQSAIMTRPDILVRHAALAMLLGAAVLMTGRGDDTTPPEAQIKRVLASRWHASYEGQPGGLTAAVITPQGEHVAVPAALGY